MRATLPDVRGHLSLGNSFAGLLLLEAGQDLCIGDVIVMLKDIGGIASVGALLVEVCKVLVDLLEFLGRVENGIVGSPNLDAFPWGLRRKTSDVAV